MSIVGPRPEVKRYVDHYSREHLEVLSVKPGLTDPATGEVTKNVAMASVETVNHAVAKAAAAFPAWRETPPLKRARIMFKYKQLLERDADEIAAMITAEHGKVIDDAMGEFMRGVEVVEYACGAPELL